MREGIWSHSCSWEELRLPDVADVERPADGVLSCGPGWTNRWTATWCRSGVQVVCPIRELASIPLTGAEPVRRFAWQPRQRHRPGLQFLVSTGRHHGFESLEEQRLLLVLDFAGALVEVLSQPFRLRFETAGGWREHVPDFLVVSRHGWWLVNVKRPGGIGTADRVCFAAAAEVALVAGWRHVVVAGWRPHVLGVLDTLSSQRRPLHDPLGLQDALVAATAGGPRPFGELVGATPLPALARAHALHLFWHRRLSVDLARSLTDRSEVLPVAEARAEARANGGAG